MTEEVCTVQGKRIGVISSIASNPNNDDEINAKFAQAVDDLRSAGILHALFSQAHEQDQEHIRASMQLCIHPQ